MANSELVDFLILNVPVSLVVRDYQEMKMRRNGKRLVGLSAFTRERTPSFTVVDRKEFFHDFSSGRHGTLFDYLIEVHDMTGRQAARHLLKRSGLKFIPRKHLRVRKRRRRTRRRGT